MPPPKLANERHILGMSTGAKTIPIARKKCRLSCSLITNTPRQYRFLAVLGPVKSPAHKFGNFHRCSHADTNLRLLFQKRSKSAYDKWPKVRVLLVTKSKTRFVILRLRAYNKQSTKLYYSYTVISLSGGLFITCKGDITLTLHSAAPPA